MTFDAVDMRERLARRNLSNEELFNDRHRDRRMVTLFEKQCDKLCGAHWLVKSSSVFIQYKSSVRYATMQGLAIGGPFLQDHKLVIDSKGIVTWDAAHVADSTSGSFENDFMSLKLFERHEFRRGRRWRSMKIELPSRLTLTINLGSSGSGVFKHFLDIFITMPIPESGTDGYCGDADGDVGDETKARVYERANSGELRVAPQESLFDRELSHQVLLEENTSSGTAKRHAVQGMDALEPLATMDCAVGSFPEALMLCSSELPEGTPDDWLDACAVDVCAGGEDMLSHSAMIANQSQEIVEDELVRASASVREPVTECHTCAPGDPCFNDVKWAMDIGIPTGYYAQRGWTPAVSEASCFEEVQGALKAWQSLPDFDIGSMAEHNFPAPCEASAERRTAHGLVFCR